MTLIAGRRAHLCQEKIGAIRFAAGCSIAVGLVFQTIEIENAGIEMKSVATINDRIRDYNSGGRIWFVGHRGWQYYAECAGWQPLDPDFTTTMPGDWLVIPDADFAGRPCAVPMSAEFVEAIEFWSRCPLGTIPYFYGTNSAIRKREGPYSTVSVYRIRHPDRK
jgi:hypothetical protein